MGAYKEFCKRGHPLKDARLYALPDGRISRFCRTCARERGNKWARSHREIKHKKTPMERFMSHVHPEPNSGCWLWDGAEIADSGYGYFNENGANCRAHRWIYTKIVSDPKDLMVLHKCDNTSCVNPDHLFIGTALDNSRDCTSKGRHPNQRKKKCKRGHDLIGDNLFVHPDGRRECRACISIRAKERRLGIR